MSKAQHSLALRGILPNGEYAQSHNADKVTAFVDDKRRVRIPNAQGPYRYLETAKDTYRLTKNTNGQKLFQGVAGTIKIHFIPKKIVATLLYWS